MNSPQPQPACVRARKENPAIGIVNNYADSDETRLFLTPEACGMISNFGYKIVMETGAGTDINYTDGDYAANNVEIVSRDKALGAADIVLSVRPLRAEDVDRMKPRAALITLFDRDLFDRSLIERYLKREVTLMALDSMCSANGLPIFRRILEEIDGRAAILYVEDGISFLGEGKGVLLAGVAGVNPCEVLIIGAGLRPAFAAKAAIAAGAKVTLMDNDVSSLYEAKNFCGDALVTSVIHPHVLYNSVKSADVILLDRCTRDFEFPRQLSVAMKQSVYFLDLTQTVPSLSVPRTVAMGISNPLINFFEEATIKGGLNSMIANTSGVRESVLTYRGKLVDKYIAMRTGLAAVNIKMMLTQTN